MDGFLLMSDKLSARDAARLLQSLHQNQVARREQVDGNDLDPQMALLRAWQVERLARTHTDLLASSRYAPACRFFLDDVYAPRNLTQRDHDLERMHQFTLKFLPGSLVRPLTLAIELNTLTQQLDQELLDVLVDELGMTETITEGLYAEGYRLCDNYAERVKQIELVGEVGHGIERVARLPLTGMTLRLARGPAQRAGWGELQEFLERGLAAFKKMRHVKGFLTMIQRRERRILDQIFAGAAEPFEVGD